jgi:rhodanese-related sulfurtransferase
MDSKDEIIARAKARAQAQGLPYAGSLLPVEANELLALDPDTKLVDVRTDAEWAWVGHVPDSTLVEWNTWPSGTPNPNFVAELKAAFPSTDTPLLFLCRSGGRSHHAAVAATKAGYAKSFNVLEGFEGDRDENDQRGHVGGWRHAGLPWAQS